MSGPLGFAARFLARRGALVEAAPDAVEALLSRELAEELGLGEHVLLAAGPGAGTQVGYGTTLLERMVSSAAAAVPFAAARARVVPSRPSQARAAAEALVFRNGVFSVGDPVPEVGHRLVAHAAFAVHGDERREGLCGAAVSLETGGAVEGFEEAVLGVLEEAEAQPSELERAAAAARAALLACGARASEAAAGFREGMQRRLDRDRERLEGYFADLLAELERRAARGRGHPADLVDRRRGLERERVAKLEALSARYVARLELRPVALLLVEAPVCRVQVELRRRKATRAIELEYDSATRRLVAPVCDACGGPAPRPAACDEAVHLVCEVCAPRSDGRITCAACRVRQTRRRSAGAA
jgi:hypothetical protein